MSAGTLYVVATPLGNLGDVSERARRTLSSVTIVAAEDTRRTRILLTHLGARPRLVSFHAHSARSRMELILSALVEGQSVALVSDAGTPTISDPGANLVTEARAIGVPVVSVPGPSAVAAALSISGLAADRYIFLGFPPRRGTERSDLLRAASVSPWTVVMFESAQRIVSLLDDLAGVCGAQRKVAVARELTKVHEEVHAGSLEEVAAAFRQRPPKGEITVVLAGNDRAVPAEDAADRREEIAQRARALLAEGTTKRDIAQILARELQLSRNEVYRMVTAL